MFKEGIAMKNQLKLIMSLFLVVLPSIAYGAASTPILRDGWEDMTAIRSYYFREDARANASKMFYFR